MENSLQEKPSDHEQIARLAYQLWEQGGRPDGCDLKFWLEAELQLRSRKKTAEGPSTGSSRSAESGAAAAVRLPSAALLVTSGPGAAARTPVQAGPETRRTGNQPGRRLKSSARRAVRL